MNGEQNESGRKMEELVQGFLDGTPRDIMRQIYRGEKKFSEETAHHRDPSKYEEDGFDPDIIKDL